jgi:glycosyltransferase involved in cell wall biosynthesis
VKKRLWYVSLGDLSKPFIAATIHCREDVRGLKKCGWDATLYTQSNGPVSSPEDVDEVVVCRNRPIVYRVVFEIALVIRLILARRKPDFVLFRGTGLLLFGFALRLMKIPFGIEVPGQPFCLLKNCSRWSWTYLSGMFLLKRACAFIVLTRELAELMSEVKDPKAIVTVTGVGVNTCDYEVAVAPETLGANGPVLGFLGTIYLDRGLNLTLEVIAKLREQGLDASLVVVGDGPGRKRAEQKAIELGISDSVNFKGFIPPEEVSGALAECDLIVAIYEHSEHLTVSGINPMKVWTSLAIGKSVLLHNPGRFDTYSEIPGIFPCPKTPPDEVVGLVAELWESYGRKGLAEAGLAGREYVVKNVTWLGHAEMIDKTIRQALQDKQG